MGHYHRGSPLGRSTDRLQHDSARAKQRRWRQLAMTAPRTWVVAVSCISVLAYVAGCGDSGITGAGGTGGGCTIPEDRVFPSGPTCEAFCQTGFVDCAVVDTPDNAACIQGCERDLACTAEESEACGDATDTMFQCAADLDCTEYAAWALAIALWPNPPTEYPCQVETETGGVACGVPAMP